MMSDRFTAIIERDGDWFTGFCPEVPGANGQGRTREECRENLFEAIAVILEFLSENPSYGVSQE